MGGTTGSLMQRLLDPSYMRRFSFIACNCEDMCCRGWRVDIDRITYHTYRAVNLPKWRSAFRKHLVRNHENPSPAQWAYIKLGSEKKCPFLTEEGFCGVQLDMGAQALSYVCATYPRGYKRLGGVLELTTTLSYPEIARLALLDPDGIEFDDTVQQMDRRFCAINR
ncbi:MAG: flagellin lysine-N-methylase [Symbiobacterium sp.]|uniref:flagellin lysine-N-methylase n=1 Tax=Symbiobacterium sp. TaxID=1971213 RepID=UPI0034648926